MHPKDLIRMFEINHSALRTNIEDITNEEALIEPKSAGNCLNWIVGHIVISRSTILSLLGEKPALPDNIAKPYKRGAEVGDACVLTSFSQIIQAFDKSQDVLKKALLRISEVVLYNVLETGNKGEEKIRLLDQLLFLHFHETYHIGQTGLLRRIVGKDCAIK